MSLLETLERDFNFNLDDLPTGVSLYHWFIGEMIIQSRVAWTSVTNVTMTATTGTKNANTCKSPGNYSANWWEAWILNQSSDLTRTGGSGSTEYGADCMSWQSDSTVPNHPNPCPTSTPKVLTRSFGPSSSEPYKSLIQDLCDPAKRTQTINFALLGGKKTIATGYGCTVHLKLEITGEGEPLAPVHSVCDCGDSGLTDDSPDEPINENRSIDRIDSNTCCVNEVDRSLGSINTRIGGVTPAWVGHKASFGSQVQARYSECYSSTKPVLDVWMPDGTHVPFKFDQTTNQYTSPAGVNSVIVGNKNGPWTLKTKHDDQYVFNSPNASGIANVSRVAYRSGHVTYYGYNSERVSAVDFSKRGIVLYFDYDSGVNTPKKGYEAGPASQGRSTYYSYSATDYLGTATKWPSGCETNTAYNSGLLYQLDDADGYQTYYTYDSQGQIVQIDRGGTTLKQYSYITPMSSPTSLISKYTVEHDGANRPTYFYFSEPTYFGYASTGTLAQRINGQGDSISTYYQYYLLKKIKDARGNSTYYEYDSAGNVISTLNALYQASSFGYDANNDLVQSLDPLGRATYFGYNAQGLVTRTLDALQNEAYFGYDSIGNLTQLLDPRGNSAYFGYDAYSRRVAALDALNHATYFGYDPNYDSMAGLRTVTENARGYSTYYCYDADSRLVETIDAYNHSTLNDYSSTGNHLAAYAQQNATTWTATYYQYDARNKVTKTTRQLGTGTIVMENGYDAGGLLDVSTDYLGHATYYGYDLASRKVKQLDAANYATYFGYDGNGNLVKSLDPRLNYAYFAYDALNRRAATLNALQYTTYFGYDAVGNQIAMQDARGYTLYYAYDALNRQTATLDALNQATYHGYDAGGNQVQLLDRRGNAAYFGYDALNRRVQTLDALGNHTYFGYDAVGNTSQVSDARDNGTYFLYDAMNRQTQITDALGNLTQSGYDYLGNTVQILDPRGYATYFVFDTLNRRSAILDALSGESYFGYDANSNLVKTIDPVGVFMYYGYDALNRQVIVEDGLLASTYFAYDGNSNRTAILDPLDRATYFGYDALNRLTATLNPDTSAVYFAFDANSNRTAECDPLGHTVYYGYDVLNRVSAMLDALGAAAYYAYDANSNLIRKRDPAGNYTYFGYDAINRLTAKHYSDTVTCYYGYDATGNRTTQLDAWGDTYYQYDALNRLTQKSFPYGTANKSQFGYDAASNLTAYRFPKSNDWNVYYAYDELNRMTAELSWIQSNFQTSYYSYDAASNLTAFQHSQILCDRTFDAANRLYDAAWYKSSTGYAYFEYDRAAGGRIDKLFRKDIERVMIYEYDANDRLTREIWKNSSGRGNVGATTYYDFQYAYDLAGNRTAQYNSLEAAETYYAYDADNSLTASWRNTAGYDTYYAYDANGSCTTIFTPNGTTYFTYTAANLVESITVQDAASNPTATYSYDGDLNRYRRTANGATYFQFWDQGRLVQEYNGDQNYTQYSYGPSQASVKGVADNELVWLAGTGTRHMLMDHRGSVIKLQNIAGSVLATREYNAFGQTLEETGTWPDAILFGYQSNWQRTGIHRPSANGTFGSGASAQLLLTKAGLYDTETGRFLYRDPIGSRRDPIGTGGLNLYTAFNNDPVNKVDPEGKLIPALVIGGIIIGSGLLLAWLLRNKKSIDSLPKQDPYACGILANQGSLSVDELRGDAPCSLVVDVYCRPAKGVIKPFAHCMIVASNSTTGKVVHTISGQPSLNTPTDQFKGGGSLGLGYTVYTPNFPDDNINFYPATKHPLTIPSGKSPCAFLDCAAHYAEQISGMYAYGGGVENSSTFISRIVRVCGGKVDLPSNAIGGYDVK